MTMAETARFLLGLREIGLSDKAIADFLLWIETGEDQYKPTQQIEDARRE